MVTRRGWERSFNDPARESYQAGEPVMCHRVASGQTTMRRLLTGGIKAILASQSNKDTARRVRRSHSERIADQGKVLGKVPYGYRPVPGSPGERVIYEPEAAIVRRLFTEYASGAGPKAIIGALNAEGVPFRDIGVELLHLWGLPSPIVTAVAERDLPHKAAESGLGVVGALRVAHLLVQQTESRDPSGGEQDDELVRLLEHPQMSARGVDWHKAAREASTQTAERLGS